MKKIIPIDIIKGFSGKFCGSNSKENFATNKCSSAYFPYRSPLVLRSTSVQPPFNLRSSSVQPPFILCSSSVRAPFNLRSSSVHPPLILRSFSVRFSIVLRSSSVHPPFNLRSAIEERTENHRRNIGESSEARRRCIETLMRNQGKGDRTKTLFLIT